METNIYIKEPPCYQKKGNASEKKLRVMERHFYNLGLLATEGQQKEMEAFIRSRGKELSLVAVDADIIHYKVVARFMKGGGRYCKVFASRDPFLRAGG